MGRAGLALLVAVLALAHGLGAPRLPRRPLTAVRPDLRICSFNIQVFGQTKMATPGVAPVLVDIIRRYDVVFVQEIRDSTGQAILDLWAQVNASQPAAEQFALVVSARLGRTSSKEQYAYFYKPALVRLVATYQYPEAADLFERPPFSAHLQLGATTFGIVGALASQPCGTRAAHSRPHRLSCVSGRRCGRNEQPQLGAMLSCASHRVR